MTSPTDEPISRRFDSSVVLSSLSRKLRRAAPPGATHVARRAGVVVHRSFLYGGAWSGRVVLDVDIASLPAPAQKALSADAPAPLRNMAARGASCRARSRPTSSPSSRCSPAPRTRSLGRDHRADHARQASRRDPERRPLGRARRLRRRPARAPRARVSPELVAGPAEAAAPRDGHARLAGRHPQTEHRSAK